LWCRERSVASEGNALEKLKQLLACVVDEIVVEGRSLTPGPLAQHRSDEVFAEGRDGFERAGRVVKAPGALKGGRTESPGINIPNPVAPTSSRRRRRPRPAVPGVDASALQKIPPGSCIPPGEGEPDGTLAGDFFELSA
jgi:hypothetical protein